MTTTEDVESGHLDRVTALHINFDGSKLLTASIDHRVKVWNIDRASGERTLVDTWTAHDADIRDAKWLHPSTGTHLATIGNDLKCTIWQEDPNQPPNSGRRFRRIDTILSKPRVPFVSLDFKNVDNVYTYLALIDRQGLLSVYEPTNFDEFKDWTLVDQFNVCIPPPGRGEQTCFKVRFDQNVTPLPYINCVSDDRRQLSLVATAMNEVKMFRAVTTTDQEIVAADTVSVGGGLPSSASDASHRFTFYEAARLPTHPALIRDVQWAPFNVRGFDLFATACKDGNVRIYELSVTEGHDPRTTSTNLTSNNNTISTTTATPSLSTNQHPNLTRSHSANLTRQSQQSSLTTAITRNTQPQPQPQSQPPHPPPPSSSNPPPSSSSSSHRHPQRPPHKFPYTTHITPSATLPAHTDAWSLSWDPSGQVLMSGGSDGSTKIWRRGILDAYQHQQSMNNGNSSSEESFSGGGGEGGVGNSGGRWMLFADQAVELGDGTMDDSDDGDDGDGDASRGSSGKGRVGSET